jgi:peptide/nickel transport system permease protein
MKNKKTSNQSNDKKKGVSQWNIAWRRFKKNKTALAGSFIIGIVLFLAAFDSLIAPFTPNDIPAFYSNVNSNNNWIDCRLLWRIN